MPTCRPGRPWRSGAREPSWREQGRMARTPRRPPSATSRSLQQPCPTEGPARSPPACRHWPGLPPRGPRARAAGGPPKAGGKRPGSDPSCQSRDRAATSATRRRASARPRAEAKAPAPTRPTVGPASPAMAQHVTPRMQRRGSPAPWPPAGRAAPRRRQRGSVRGRAPKCLWSESSRCATRQASPCLTSAADRRRVSFSHPTTAGRPRN
mmetsp:Transcript_174933/g.560959  ORF Transcript_174933/g.560959 Transcript_174933/m.560959 type:complete len:209 (-) Transcript_174933:249-875(-)